MVVIGAGFGGLGAAAELLRRGHTDVTVLERGADVGGVWRDNTYPGAACDVPSTLYSWSFAPHAGWRRRYADQADILDYVRRTAAQLGIAPRLRTGVEVTALTFDDGSGRWRLDTAGGERLEADVVVAALGQLSRPAVPELPGANRFRGPAFHSARWRHDIDLRGKRVAVLGTGASAIQFVPEVQKVAAQVTVLQRSAPYVVPKPDRAYTALHHAAFARFPATQAAARRGVQLLSEQLNHALTSGRALRPLLTALWRLNLRLQVRDPDLRRALTPDYPLGCKRLLFSNAWYAALTQPHVSVVTDAVEEVTPTGVRTADGREHPADVLIYGTGFRATEFLAPLTVRGRGGRDLQAQWAGGASAHLGITVPGFPNLFLVYGPNTNLGGSSIISMMEPQAAYIGQVVDALRDGRLRLAEVRDDVARAYDEEIQDRLRGSVWQSCSSWYATGSGRVTTNWPGLVSEYRRRTAVARLEDFVDALAPAASPAPRTREEVPA